MLSMNFSLIQKIADSEDPLLEIAPTTTVTVMRSYATTRAPRTHKAREKAKQLLIQSERAAQDRTLLVRMRAGLQQRITEEQAKYASANPAGHAAHTKLKNKSGGEATTETSMMMIWEARNPAPMEEAARQPASSLGGEADCQTANT